MKAVALEALNGGTEAGFVDALGGMFEHAPWVAAAAAKGRPYAGLPQLFDAMRRIVLDSGGERRIELLRGHPELAGLAARSGSMEPSSVAEQAGAGLDALSSERAQTFDDLNAAYLARFGFPFIIAVRRHGRDSILGEFRRRLGSAREAETETALAEVFRIVALRLDDAVAAPDRLPVTGRLSTHVLDTAYGVPAQGVAVTLVELSTDAPARIISTAVTNAGGRTDTPLVADRPLPIARYELRFELADYFRARGTVLEEPPFLDVVPIRFGVAQPEAHYHVPLAATPWSYQTYRGS